jgi:Apea-like HEPN
MEALFLREEEGLSFRLALRAANLLGADAAERRAIYKQVKELYDVRSKVVHGDVLKEKHTLALQNVGTLREMVRCRLLSDLGLLSGPGLGKDYYVQLDAVNLDEEARRVLQTAASVYLSMTQRHQEGGIKTK